METQRPDLFIEACKFGQWPKAKHERLARLLLSRMTRRQLEVDLLELIENHHYLGGKLLKAEESWRRAGPIFVEQRTRLQAAEREAQQLRTQLEELRAKQQPQQRQAPPQAAPVQVQQHSAAGVSPLPHRHPHPRPAPVHVVPGPLPMHSPANVAPSPFQQPAKLWPQMTPGIAQRGHEVDIDPLAGLGTVSS
ncbi:unnamed protein product [Vitrella brassicaformis CCMP3155]|uniref:Uncharacterized protein n=1 Tax=Vitrella brassicaformis (strain CCMP3155) TaxID=1169540 RepID=A0A0G4EFJ3_VITBC|nr:unnamed protein product [Vitrella brassicaformis CCMP3155]|eukprot:CEL94143.1 unnamed protein product [Vitrella brassicaformis CCMP3155]